VTSVFVAATPDEAARVACKRMRSAIDEARASRSVAHIALAGGTTPRHTYELLAGKTDDWSGVEVWFGDERAVGADDPESNYRMVQETLLGGGSGPDVHRIEGERGPETAAAGYAELLAERLPSEGGVPVLDLALQGLGPDGHTASLFPGNPAVEADGICVAVHGAPKPPPDRITLTVPALRAARAIVFLATGAEKTQAVGELLAGPNPAIPSSLLSGERTEVIVDRAAASSDVPYAQNHGK
jgi:6-phosphogluconolactonase